MHENRFSTWIAWPERRALSDIACPGVYVIAHSKRDLAGQSFEWVREIIYIGMTNAISGLRGRLGQFDDTISRRRTSHGGADRVRFKHRDYDAFSAALYVAVAPIKCNPASNLAIDLRKMGKVANLEFQCFAEYVESFGHLPEFNDKVSAPKLGKVVV